MLRSSTVLFALMSNFVVMHSSFAESVLSTGEIIEQNSNRAQDSPDAQMTAPYSVAQPNGRNLSDGTAPDAGLLRSVPADIAATVNPDRGESSDIAASFDSTPETAGVSDDRPVHVLRVAPFPKGYRMQANLVTSIGTISCELYADTHPLTVLNFVALAKGSPGWLDASGITHTTPYYRDLDFGARKPGAYVVSGTRDEGTGFYVVDERCSEHRPVAGALAMVQSHPGTASANFMLLARDLTEFSGMYDIFGQCDKTDLIDRLSKQKASLMRVEIVDRN